jgi:transcriptional regulator with XRE-family HTH domain
MTSFKQLRRAKGLNNVSFCQKAGISPSTLSALENGKPVSLLTAAKACNALGVDMKEVEGIVLSNDDSAPAAR